MKKLAIYILLIAFAIKPLYNACYLLYYQLNTSYITELFCENKEKIELACNGQCHLVKQLQKDSSIEDDQNILRISSEVFSLVFFENFIDFDFFRLKYLLDKETSKYRIQNYAYSFNYECFRPPIS